MYIPSEFTSNCERGVGNDVVSAQIDAALDHYYNLSTLIAKARFYSPFHGATVCAVTVERHFLEERASVTRSQQSARPVLCLGETG